ncbi:hypothetical protein [Variovorax paradoxus]|uniref:hypothetical protein n=1 Tax=Variovorax paradoxus TaxID=34073 RepID=UPI0029C685A4|nr:hypothetical protein [Variovorax paradoxus]WPH18244.1 hypothetical protein RZE78_14500 [Variovorax paradoxus]
MRILKFLMILVGCLGAILTFPMPSLLGEPGAWVFLGISVAFAVLAFFGFRMKPRESKEAPGAPQSTQAAQSQDH